jgi:hypothetical protein
MVGKKNARKPCINHKQITSGRKKQYRPAATAIRGIQKDKYKGRIDLTREDDNNHQRTTRSSTSSGITRSSTSSSSSLLLRTHNKIWDDCQVQDLCEAYLNSIPNRKLFLLFHPTGLDTEGGQLRLAAFLNGEGDEDICVTCLHVPSHFFFIAVHRIEQVFISIDPLSGASKRGHLNRKLQRWCPELTYEIRTHYQEVGIEGMYPQSGWSCGPLSAVYMGWYIRNYHRVLATGKFTFSVSKQDNDWIRSEFNLYWKL